MTNPTLEARLAALESTVSLLQDELTESQRAHAAALGRLSATQAALMALIKHQPDQEALRDRTQTYLNQMEATIVFQSRQESHLDGFQKMAHSLKQLLR